MDDPERAARHALADRLAAEGLADARVAEALRRVPRHLFVPDPYRRWAYRDEPLAIGEGQTISAPHMVAIMATRLALASGSRVLEVGGGSGYHAAVAAELVRPGGHVWSVERLPGLAAKAREALADAGYGDDVTVVVADGSEGLSDLAPFDRIFVAAASPTIPPPLLVQLAPGGRLLVPVGDASAQVLLLVEKGAETTTTSLGPVRFVPLVGKHGFPAGPSLPENP